MLTFTDSLDKHFLQYTILIVGSVSTVTCGTVCRLCIGGRSSEQEA